MSRESGLKTILGGVLVAIIAAVLAASNAAQTTSNSTIYACVNPAGLVRVIPPRAACLGSEQPIQWNVTGPAGPIGPAGPRGPEGPQGPPGEGAGPTAVLVDCAAGQTVNAALVESADRSGRLFIMIRGVCREGVYIARDDVELRGESPGDGLAAPGSNVNVLAVAGGQRIHLQQLTLDGGSYGFLVSNGAAVSGEGVRITGASQGLCIWDGTVRLSDSTIDANGTNVTVGAGYLLLSRSTISNATSIGAHVAGGSIDLDHATVEGNAVFGLGIMQAHVGVTNSVFRNNGRLGIWLHGGGLRIGDSVIADHTGHGIEASAATVEVGGTTIEHNGWSGIQAMMGSRIIVGAANVISDNAQHGIWLKDTSVVSGFDPAGTQITRNTRYGIFCDPAPAVAQIGPHYSGVGFILDTTHAFGNSEGQISCPGIGF
jgi:hypothetical protein